MRKRPILLSLVAIAIGCIHQVVTTPPEIVIEPGLKAFPTPRAFDGVGTITRIDREGVSHPFAMLKVTPPPTLNPEQLPQYKMTDTVGASLLLSFLRKLAGSPSVGGVVGKTVVLSFTAVGTQRERSNDLDLRQALKPILGQLDFSDGSRYYLISETVLADSIAYTVAQSQVDSLGGSANLQNVAKGNVGIRRNGSSEYTLIARLRPPMRIFYKAEEILPVGSGGYTISSQTHFEHGHPTDVNQLRLVKDTTHFPVIREH